MRYAPWLLALIASSHILASPRIEEEAFLPYRFNHAVVVDDDGVTGSVDLEGVRWDGTRAALFHTDVNAKTPRVDLLFYLDEDFRALELHIPGQEFPLLVDLAKRESESPALPKEETALRTRMRGLDPPSALASDGDTPAQFSLQGSDLVMAGFQASSRLFGLPIPRAPLVMLGCFSLFAVAIPILSRGQKKWKTLVRAIAAMAATGLAVFLSHPKPVLFQVAFSDDGPGSRVSGILERQMEEWPNFTQVSYAAGQGEQAGFARPGKVQLVGIWAPTLQGVPLDEVASTESLVRFSSPPLVTMIDGGAHLRSTAFITGWVVHENH
jgi:hypothetical protein